MAVIRTDRLTKYYGDVVGIADVSVEVAAGEVFGFLGPNGAGKTTTIRLLLDLLQPSSGDAWIGGFHCRRQGLDARRLVGYLPGELPYHPEISGRRYLAYLTALGGRPAPSGWLEHLLRRFDVSDVDLRRPMREYSHGMKRKLGILQALAPRPPVLVLDEPTSGLDPLMIEAFAETLHVLRTTHGTTVFLSSHVLSEVEKTCGRVGLIRRGRLVAVRSLDEIRASMPRRVTVTFAAPVDGAILPPGAGTLVSRTPQSWVVDARGALGPLVTSLAALPVADVQVQTFTLEDYVLRMYGDE